MDEQTAEIRRPVPDSSPVHQHRPNAVTEGVWHADPEVSTEQTRVKCEGDRCDFYVERPRWHDALAEHDRHVAEVLAEEVRDVVSGLVNSAYGTNPRHALLGIAAANKIVYDQPVPWSLSDHFARPSVRPDSDGAGE